MPEDREDQEPAERSYRRVDQRVRLDDDPPPADTPPEPEPEPEAQPAEALPVIDVYGLLRMSLGMFVEQAWVQMGIQLGPGQKELVTDLHQARVAIDMVSAMKDGLGDNLNAEEKREVEQVLSTLRLNYVQRA